MTITPCNAHTRCTTTPIRMRMHSKRWCRMNIQRCRRSCGNDLHSAQTVRKCPWELIPLQIHARPRICLVHCTVRHSWDIPLLAGRSRAFNHTWMHTNGLPSQSQGLGRMNSRRVAGSDVHHYSRVGTPLLLPQKTIHCGLFQPASRTAPQLLPQRTISETSPLLVIASHRKNSESMCSKFSHQEE